MLAEGLGRLIVGAEFDDDGIVAGTRLRFGDRDPRDRPTAVERVETAGPAVLRRTDASISRRIPIASADCGSSVDEVIKMLL